jgi:hypothetical protein
MIELKLSTVNAAVLLATSRYFSELADAMGFQTPCATVAPSYHSEEDQTIAAARSPYLPAPAAVNVDDEEEEAPPADDEEEEAPIPPAAVDVGSFAAAGIELDSAGFPWDHRIHASTKTKIGNGTWKLKPRVEPTLIEQVRAEYKQAAAAPRTITPPMIPQAAAVEPVPTQPTPPAIAAPVIAPPPASAEKPTNPGLLFAATLKLYADVEAAGKVQPGAGDSWAKAAGLPSLASLITRPDLCGAFYDQLKGML